MKRLVLFLACLYWTATAQLPPPSPAYDDPKLYAQIKTMLLGNEDVVRRNIRRLGNRTIELEYFVSAEGNHAMAAKVLCDFPALPTWTLNNINKTPDGKPYKFQVTGLKIQPESDIKALADLEFKFDMPLFKYAGKRGYQLHCEKGKTNTTIHAEAAPHPTSIVESSKGFLQIYPAVGAPSKMWMYLRGVIRLSNSVLYELMPEKIVNREASERVYILLANYLKEEDRILDLKKNQNAQK